MNAFEWPEPRPITEYELAIVKRLVSARADRERWIAQADGAEVCQTDDEGTIFFKRALHLAGNPFEQVANGYFTDMDGTEVGYILHSIRGELYELEVYKSSPAPLLRRPKPEEIEVL